MNPALLFLLRRSAANAVRAKIRRLRSPRYLVPTLLGAAYFAVVFGGGFGEGPPASREPDPARGLLLEWGITAGTLALSCLSWILPVRGAPLAFLEPEVTHLFPAPVTRRDLVLYKLLDLQKFFVLGPLLIGLLNLRSLGPAGAASLALGFWLALNATTLHGIGAKMTRLSLAEHGWSGWRRNLLPVGVLAAYLGLVVLGTPPLPGMPGQGRWGEELGPWIAEFDGSAAARLLLPVRAVVHPFFARGAAEYALALAGAAAVLVLLFLWVLRTDVAFEEAAAAQAETLSRRIEAARRGRLVAAEPGRPARRHPFPLSPEGPPESAFVWKSVAEVLRGVSPRLLLFAGIAVLIAIPVSLDVARDRGEGGARILAGASVVMGFLAGLLVFAGPSVIGVNLRHDLERVDVLKTFPLSGARLVRCSILGNLAPVAVLQAVLVLGAVLLFPDPPKFPITPGWRLAAAAMGLAGLPALTAVSASVDAALVLLFPGWVRPGAQAPQGGMEGMGYGMLATVVKFLALTLGLAVPGGVGLAIGFVGARLGGPLWAPAAATAGVLAGAVLVAGEVALLAGLLGRRFERLDPAEEGLGA